LFVACAAADRAAVLVGREVGQRTGNGAVAVSLVSVCADRVGIVRDLDDATRHLQKAVIAHDIIVARKIEILVVEAILQLRHVQHVPFLAELDFRDQRRAELLSGDLCQECTVTAGIERGMKEPWQPVDDVKQDLLLCREGNVAQLQQEWRAAN